MNSIDDYDHRVMVVLLGVVFLVIGIIAGIVSYFTIKSDYSLRNDNWMCVRGAIEKFSFEYRISVSGGGGSFWVHCSYAYDVNGVQFRSDRVSIGASSEGEHKEIVKRKKGNTIPVWVKENDYSVSVLTNPSERDYSGSILLCFIAVSMLLGAVICWLVAAFGDRKRTYRVVNINC